MILKSGSCSLSTSNSVQTKPYTTTGHCQKMSRTSSLLPFWQRRPSRVLCWFSRSRDVVVGWTQLWTLIFAIIPIMPLCPFDEKMFSFDTGGKCVSRAKMLNAPFSGDGFWSLSFLCLFWNAKDLAAFVFWWTSLNAQISALFVPCWWYCAELDLSLRWMLSCDYLFY